MIRSPGGNPTAVSGTNSTGPVTGVKTWMGSATSGTGGTWTADISKAGFTGVPFVLANALATATTASGAMRAVVSSVTATTVTGQCYQPQAISILGSFGITAAPTGVSIQVLAIGT